MARLRVMAGLVCVVALFGWCAAAAAGVELTRSQQVQILEEAFEAFDRGGDARRSDASAAVEAFGEAARRFQLLVDAGIRNGKLYYNLGNAYLESGDIGRAILNYRRARELMPGDGRLEHNLAYARSLRRNQIESAGGRAFVHTLFFWHYGTSLRSRFLVGLMAYVVFWVWLLARVWFRRLPWRAVAIPALVIWVVLGVSVVFDVFSAARHGEGVIVADNVVVRKGNGEGFAPQFKQKLHEGVEFVVLEAHKDWLHVELPDGKSGWIRADQGELI